MWKAELEDTDEDTCCRCVVVMSSNEAMNRKKMPSLQNVETRLECDVTLSCAGMVIHKTLE